MLMRQAIRRFSTTLARRSGHDEPDGFPGANLPFSIRNRYTLLLGFGIFFGSGLAAPYLVVRHQMLK